VKFYGMEALRQIREQQAAEPASGMKHNGDQEAAAEQADESIVIEEGTEDEGDAFEELYEAWIDFGMESGG
jgi:hypothetical protein